MQLRDSDISLEGPREGVGEWGSQAPRVGLPFAETSCLHSTVLVKGQPAFAIS